MTTTTMPIADSGLAMMTLKHNVKLVNDLPDKKVWTELMLWRLNRFRNAHPGINTSKTFVGNIYRSQQERFYRDLLKAWSDLTDSEMPEPTTLQEIFNEPLSQY